MNVSDYIVEFLIEKKIGQAFGYPGGTVVHLMESFRKHEGKIKAHVVYQEQAAALAACAYAETTGVPGAAYAIGGPGATNMVTGIGHAYYESIPVLFFTGNVNTYEAHGEIPVRQRGFQESDIVSVVKPLTKFAVYVKRPEDIRYCLEKAYDMAMEGRKGPVLLDLPMDVQRAVIEPSALRGYEAIEKEDCGNIFDAFCKTVHEVLVSAKAPCLVFGKGAKNAKESALRTVWNLKIPCVTSMIAFDIFDENNPYSYGFIGAYGDRAANFVLAKSDLVIAIGSRLDIRQVGAVRENFAPGAKIIRVDYDAGELTYKVHADELSFCISAERALHYLSNMKPENSYTHWNEACKMIKRKLCGIDDRLPNEYVAELSRYVPDHAVITTDVGQNQVWVAQSFKVKSHQQVLFSGGMGAMGHALPAAIGAYYGSGGRSVFCICGDGGLQMNIQELQFVFREQLPVKIIVFNNYSLGMIRHFQEMYFNNAYFQTKPDGGYTSPDFTKIAKAYGIDSMAINQFHELGKAEPLLSHEGPALIEIRIREDTYVAPKLEYGKPNHDQEPLIDRKLLKELMEL